MREWERLVRRGMRDTLFSRSLTTLLIIFNLPHLLISPSTSLTLPQHPMIRRYSSIVVNVEILTYELFAFFSHNAYPTLRCVLQKFCLCHLEICLKCDVNFDTFVFKILYNYNRRKNPILCIIYRQYEVF